MLNFGLGLFASYCTDERKLLYQLGIPFLLGFNNTSTLSCFTGWGFGIFYHKRNFSDYKS